MDCVVQLFGNLETTPKLNIKLHFAGSKCISTPNVKDIIEQYCSALNLVCILKYISIDFINLNYCYF